MNEVEKRIIPLDMAHGESHFSIKCQNIGRATFAVVLFSRVTATRTFQGSLETCSSQIGVSTHLQKGFSTQLTLYQFRL